MASNPLSNTTDISTTAGSLPPLPELFGNPLLRGHLVEIQPTAEVDWLPQTPGWYLLAAALLLWVGHRGWRHWRRWLRNRYRREALQRLETLARSAKLEHVAGESSVAAVNEVLKLAAMTASSRQEVAPLSGQAWLSWLDTRTATAVFSDASRYLLATAIYQTADTPPAEHLPISGLIDETRIWLLQHRDDHAPA